MAFAALFADSLYCSEEHLDDLYQEPAEEHWPEQQPALLLDDELPALFDALRGKEEVVLEDGDRYGGNAGRTAAVGWATRATARLGFSALTAALATAYLDRCFLGGGALQLGEPWMARLAAVACVALAAKVEETRVPELLDLQLLAAETAGEAFVFEAKTVRRMEFLVLNALAWRMHPVTPFSFLQPVLAAEPARLHQCDSVLFAVMAGVFLALFPSLHCIALHCRLRVYKTRSLCCPYANRERVLNSDSARVADWRWPQHRPSVWAAAALLATAGFGNDDGDTELLELINAPKDEVAECAKMLSLEAPAGFTGFVVDNKRKRAPAGLYSPPLSPSGVIGAAAYFSCESSTSSADSRSGAVTTAWPGCVSVSSSPEPPSRPLKRAVATAILPPDEESRDAWH
ncbi:unnamed protein product [Alopecurus aequalis]